MKWFATIYWMGIVPFKTAQNLNNGMDWVGPNEIEL
jgi:hypothetical protein